VNRNIAKGLVSIIGGKLTTYRNLAEQTVDKLARILRRRLPECRTQNTELPGVWGQDRAREKLLELQVLSPGGIDRLISIYGGRAAAIADIAANDAMLNRILGQEEQLLAAEIVFTIREEFARTLTDIVFRRTMIGFDPDQGRAHYTAIAGAAASEFGWTAAQVAEELDTLKNYADSLRVS
jgi:glycerol-3-phosphate dehydrogenase